MPSILAPYVATPHEVVARMLEAAGVGAEDVVLDLGCGDGRICVAAARDFGARAVGVDIEPYWVEQAQALARAAGVEERTTFRVGDAREWDAGEATVIALYLVYWSTQVIVREVLARARAGTRVVSHRYVIEGHPLEDCHRVTDAEGRVHRFYLWRLGADGALIAERGRD